MGMDVYSRDEQHYFRRSVWGWHPLADYVIDLHPDLAAKVQHWHTNDGDGLNEADSHELARRLHEQVANGEAARYVEIRNAALASLPDEQCELCHGTGVRMDQVGIDMHMVERGWCNGCDGKGSKRPWATNYGLDVDDVREFADFLAVCDGFHIY
jgi:hypothetical protein